MQMILKNVRCFHSHAPIALRPLTILVGENSSGKTTFLSMISHVCDNEFPFFRPTFSDPPFDLGSFDSIATFKGGRGGRAETFSIGYDLNSSTDVSRRVVATYRSWKGQPQLAELQASGKTGELSLEMSDDIFHSKAFVTLKTQGKTEKNEIELDLRQFATPDYPVRFILRAFLMEPPKQTDSEASFISALDHIKLLNLLKGTGRTALAMAPVRSRPKRTFDETSGDFDPEGQHIFVLLARLWQEESAERDKVFDSINRFGESSSLYNRINMKLLGKKPSDPFQVLVRLGGPPANLLDVGYGVSQALPVIVQSILQADNKLLLLQQPEVHLHPRAQAALGSFFTSLVATQQKELVIETHSDYLLDRIRIDVAQGVIPASSVQILFFDRRGIRTLVHPIELDERGNVVRPPKSYRQFFLEEELNLFKRAK